MVSDRSRRGFMIVLAGLLVGTSGVASSAAPSARDAYRGHLRDVIPCAVQTDGDALVEVTGPCSDAFRDPPATGLGAPAPAQDAVCAPALTVDDQCETWAVTHDPPVGSALTMGIAMSAGPCPPGTPASTECERVFTTGWEEVSGVSAYGVVAHDATTGALLWNAIYRSGGWDEVADIDVSSDGSRVFVTGRCCGSPTGGWQFATVAFDAIAGSRLWATRYDGPDPTITDLALSLDISPDDSRVYVTGVSGRDARTIAYNATTGSEAWSASYAGPEGGVDQGFEVVASPDGERVYVGGASFGGGSNTSNYDYLLLAYSARSHEDEEIEEGDQLWATRLDNGTGGSDVAQALTVSADGSKVFASGIARSVGLTTGGLYANYEFLTVGADSATGEIEWTSRYAGGSGGLNGANDIAVAPNGSRVFITGPSTADHNAMDIDIVTIAMDARTGERSWVGRLATPGHWPEVGNRVGVAPDGSRVFTSGSSLAIQASSILRADTVTLAYDAASGAQAWVARHNTSPAAIDTSFAGFLAVAPDGEHVYTAGMSLVKGFGGVFATMAYPTRGLLDVRAAQAPPSVGSAAS